MESLKTAFISIAVAAGILLVTCHRQPKHEWLALLIIFSLYVLGACFYDWRKFRRALERARQEINLQENS